MEKYICSGCKKSYLRKRIGQYSSGSPIYVTPEGLKQGGAVCRDCRLAKNRSRYEGGPMKATLQRYNHTPAGFLVRLYRNMKSRVEGIQWKKSHLYKGKTLLPKADFYVWALSSPSFWALYEPFIKSGRDRRLTPTVDRIDASKGYEISNMRWLTHSQNSSLGNASRYRRGPEAQKDSMA
jgi:hypothetical protein